MLIELRQKYGGTDALADYFPDLAAAHPTWVTDPKSWYRTKLTALAVAYGATDTVFDLAAKFWRTATANTVL